MKTIIVPTDYSEVAAHAAVYALQLARHLSIRQLCFVNAYQAAPIMSEATMPAMPVVDVDMLKNVSQQGMEHFVNDVRANFSEGIQISTRTVFGNVTDAVIEAAREMNAAMIVMGVTGSSKLEEVLIGSTATSLMLQADIPVLIVPPGATCSGWRRLLFACDLKNVVETTPVHVIKDLIGKCGATLHVVNVYEGEHAIAAEKTYQQALLQSLLSDVHPQFHFIRDQHFAEALNRFADEHQIDLMITIPKKHSFFHNLFRERHSKQLAFHSHVPLLCIHQEAV